MYPEYEDIQIDFFNGFREAPILPKILFLSNPNILQKATFIFLATPFTCTTIPSVLMFAKYSRSVKFVDIFWDIAYISDYLLTVKGLRIFN